MLEAIEDTVDGIYLSKLIFDGELVAEFTLKGIGNQIPHFFAFSRADWCFRRSVRNLKCNYRRSAIVLELAMVKDNPNVLGYFGNQMP